MTIDRKRFFTVVREKLHSGSLTQPQVDGYNAILDEWEKRKLADLRWLAYMLATGYWETNRTLQPVVEAYWLSEGWRKLHLSYYPYYGRGLVQLTWEDNYLKMSKVLGIDLVKNPERACELPVAVAILFEGMLKAETGVGDFTYRSLEEFFNDTTEAPVDARRIINGSDKAEEIAAIYYIYKAALAAPKEALGL